jgi:exodeoxyribonuclease-3
MRIATWNINSVRLRIENLKKFADQVGPDIICLQETKVRDEDFPLEAITSFGYQHVEFCGEKSYNGVAIISKIPLRQTERMKIAHPDQCRHISALLPDGTELHNFYVPAGGDEPDVTINPKFAHKLAFMDEATAWFSRNRTQNDRVILVGDINIAPLEHDVWSHKQLLKIVSHTPIEVEKMAALQKSLNFIDVCRLHVAPSEKLYSWWSYRNRDWRTSDRGRRLDHILVSPAMGGEITHSHILKEARDWQQPSDHVPVIAEFSR